MIGRMPRKKAKSIEIVSDKITADSLEKSKDENGSESSSTDDKLEKELSWCIDQLRIGLMSQKPTPEQVQKSVKLIKTLSSKSAPLVKKRQIMRQTFGDYRKKMSDEESRWEKDAAKVRKNAAVQSCNLPEKGIFCRSSSGASCCPTRTFGTCTERQCEGKEEPLKQGGFKFNFTIPDD